MENHKKLYSTFELEIPDKHTGTEDDVTWQPSFKWIHAVKVLPKTGNTSQKLRTQILQLYQLTVSKTGVFRCFNTVEFIPGTAE